MTRSQNSLRRAPVRLALCAALSAGAAALALTGSAFAASYQLPPAGQTVIGQIEYVSTAAEDTFIDIARRHNIGYEEIVAANPGVDPWLPGDGTRVIIPSQYVLPAVPWEGIVVNLAERRLYYFPQPKPGQRAMVMTFPVGIGRMDWETPLGVTEVVARVVRPAWYPPASVRRERQAQGLPALPAIVPPGPDNPLGEYAMKLGIAGGGYLIHGTHRSAGVGMDVSHGCIRMFPDVSGRHRAAFSTHSSPGPSQHHQ